MVSSADVEVTAQAGNQFAARLEGYADKGQALTLKANGATLNVEAKAQRGGHFNFSDFFFGASKDQARGRIQNFLPLRENLELLPDFQAGG